MREIVISDTSCLIAIEKIIGLGLLQRLYDRITIPDEVAEEYGELLPDWIECKSVTSRSTYRLFKETLGAGEAAAISLALEHENSLVLLDDQKARKTAVRYGIVITGVLGVLIRAKKEGLIVEIRPLINKLREVGFYISKRMEQKILVMADE